jgi:hypothetical protein
LREDSYTVPNDDSLAKRRHADWNLIARRVVKELPRGFEEFSSIIENVLIEFGDSKIYDIDTAVSRILIGSWMLP